MLKRSGADASENVNQWREGFAKHRWWHSFELPDGRRIEGVNDLESLKRRIGLFPIPENLSGKRVLDIGAWDGWFSFEMERRGAEVVSIDCVESKNFRFLHRELHSKIDYRLLDVYDLTPAKLGRFDIVLFLGVLYHLKHPLLGLERVCALTKHLAAIQTYVSPDNGPPSMEFFETDELGGQFDNWVAPNPSCVLAMCRTAGFARAELIDVNEFSAATVACFRHFEPSKSSTAPAPNLINCAEMVRFGLNFSSQQDHYVTAWFASEREDPDPENLQASVGAFHSRPAFVGKIGDHWQANFKLPPGLEPGWHEVRLRTLTSPWSNPFRIAVDLPLLVNALEITGASDGNTWKPNEIGLTDHSVLALWVRGIPENVGRGEIQVRIGDHELDIEFLSPWESGKASQVNARMPEEIQPGPYPVTLEIAGVVSAPAIVNCRSRGR